MKDMNILKSLRGRNGNRTVFLEGVILAFQEILPIHVGERWLEEGRTTVPWR
jgi:hypothetical protein